MRRLKLSKDWRPSWKAFGLLWVICAGVNMVVTSIAAQFGYGSVDVYPPHSIFGKLLFTLNVLILIGFVFISAGLKLNKDYPPPEPHPFATSAFWRTMSSSLLVAFVATVLLRAIGVQIFPQSWGETIKAESSAITLAAMTILGMLKLRGEPQFLGLSFGLGTYLLVTFCTL